MPPGRTLRWREAHRLSKHLAIGIIPLGGLSFTHLYILHLPAPWGKKIIRQRTPGSRRGTPSPAAKNFSHLNLQNNIET